MAAGVGELLRSLGAENLLLIGVLFGMLERFLGGFKLGYLFRGGDAERETKNQG